MRAVVFCGLFGQQVGRVGWSTGLWGCMHEID